MAKYIDREALEKAMTVAAVNGKDKDRRTWAKAICVLHDIPTVDLVPVVHGEFIHDGPRFRGGVDWWHCSNCEKLVSGVEVKYKYCPECGCRMDGGDDNAAD